MTGAQPSSSPVVLHAALVAFDRFIGNVGPHTFATGGRVYIQPYVDISFHVIQMHAAGWTDADFDALMAVSGASAPFGYEIGDFMAKYAHLDAGPEQRIADATGFGYAWVGFEGLEEAWSLIRNSVNAGKSLKGWDWENILFAGYQDAETPEDRKVYAMVDGPETYSRWISWAEFAEWYDRVRRRGPVSLGEHTGRVPVKPARDVALRVIEDLVAWSSKAPARVYEWIPNATFGLDGIEVYAAMVDDVESYADVIACHDINPQWAARNATGIYLKHVVEAGLFSDRASAHLSVAAEQYRAIYECWEAYYKLLGHNTTELARGVAARRQAGTAIVRAWLAHERAAIAELEQVLQAV